MSGNAQKEATMQTFEFAVIASGLDPEDYDFDSCFYDAGCDDATVSVRGGRIIVDFAREASSIDEAIASAIECVRRAGATVDRVEPDYLVNLTDIADRIGVTRATVSNYARGERREGFPPPVARVTTNTPLYDWSDVAVWLYRHNQLPKEAAIEALAVKTANDLVRDPHIAAVLRERLRAAEAELEDA